MIESMLASRRCSTMLCRFCLNSGTGTCCRALQHSRLEYPSIASQHSTIEFSCQRMPLKLSVPPSITSCVCVVPQLENAVRNAM